VPGLEAADLASVGPAGNLVPLPGRHVRIQTPQVFVAAPLLQAYLQAAETGFEGTDTAACVEQFSCLDIVHVAGEEQNFKITYPHDLHTANEFVRRRN
jgi:2-C-methyl-D-erythritol 4-phosphate cytidylyltransferase